MNTQQGLDEIERIAADETVVANVESEAEVKMAETIPVETPPAVVPSVDDSSLYIHRELSQLQFNIRVLEQALDESYPLLERLKFLLIFSSNLDEFFEIRIAGLKKQITFAREQAGADGLLPHQALARISELVHEQVSRQYRILNETLLPELAKHQIRFIRRRHWTLKIKTWVRRFFRDEIAPIITPIGLDPTHPFPLLVNKSLNFIVELEGMDAFGRDSGLAIIPAPRLLPRIIRLPEDVGGEGDNYVFLSSMIHAHADDLFPGMKVKGCYQFRLTRNADLSVDTEDVEDLARALRGELFSRRYGDAVRLEVVDTCPQNLTNYLLKQFGLSESELYKVSGPVNLTRLFSVTGLESHPELQYPPFTPAIPRLLQKKENLFNVLSKLDVLLMHPFESFTPVIDLLRQAAKDPNVLAIKQTLYRSGANSEIVDALVEAARNGKEVTAVIELRARFDEESNLQLASRLQQAGAVVIYGVVGFKTHAKMMLILRREDGELRRYAHLGTGNYHAGNARLYTDYSLLTADVALCEDLHKLFNQLIGMGKTLRMKKLLHAPFTLEEPAGNDQPRGGPGGARPACAHHGQGQLADRSEGHPRPVQGQPGRGQDRPGGAWHVLPAAGHPGGLAQYPRALDHRALPRAQPHLLLPQRRRREALSLQRRLDGAQPRHARRDLLPGGRQEAGAAGQEGTGNVPDRQHPGLGVAGRR